MKDSILENYEAIRKALEQKRLSAGPDKGRNLSIAITELENSQMRYERSLK